MTRDLRGRRGTVTGEKRDGAFVTLVALVPLANLFGYEATLRACTQRHGRFTARSAEYRPVSPPDDDDPPPAMAAALRR